MRITTFQKHPSRMHTSLIVDLQWKIQMMTGKSMPSWIIKNWIAYNGWYYASLMHLNKLKAKSIQIHLVQIQQYQLNDDTKRKLKNCQWNHNLALKSKEHQSAYNFFHWFDSVFRTKQTQSISKSHPDRKNLTVGAEKSEDPRSPPVDNWNSLLLLIHRLKIKIFQPHQRLRDPAPYFRPHQKTHWHLHFNINSYLTAVSSTHPANQTPSADRELCCRHRPIPLKLWIFGSWNPKTTDPRMWETKKYNSTMDIPLLLSDRNRLERRTHNAIRQPDRPAHRTDVPTRTGTSAFPLLTQSPHQWVQWNAPTCWNSKNKQ